MNSQCDAEPSLFDGLSPDQQRRLTDVLDEYFRSIEQGRPLNREQLQARHPDLAEPIATYLESLDFLQNAAAGFTSSAEPIELIDGCDGSAKQIGDFRILREIGRGGMGVVYEAWQLSLDRRVALKVLPFAALLDAKQIARFRNEAQAAAQLVHSHIVPVFAVGVDRGVHYYAMQFIDGQPLDRAIEELRACAGQDRRVGWDHCPDRSLPEQAASSTGQWSHPTTATLAEQYSSGAPGYFRIVAQLGIQAAEALHAAHEFGIVHRDVKPSNLLLDAEGKLWVTDFGLARCRTSDPGAKLTRTGDFVGTMRYMSPEQTQGQSHLVDHRTDCYSLGVTLYELLTLRHAVRGDAPADVLRELDRDRPYRPRLSNPNIPADLENIILKAIAKDRDERYLSAQQFADDLRRFLDGKPTIARRPTVIQRAGKWARRHKRAVAASIGVMTLVLAGLVVSNLMLAVEKNRTEQALAEARENHRRYRAQLAVSHNHLAMLQDQNGDVRQAERSFRKAIELYREILAECPADNNALQGLATALGNLSFFYAKRDPLQAADCYKETLRLQQRLVDLDPTNLDYQSNLALTYSNAASFHRGQGDSKRAFAFYQRAIALLEEIRMRTGSEPAHCRDLAISYNNLGMTQSALGEFVQAEQSLRNALRVLTDYVSGDAPTPKDSSSVGGVYNNLGMVLEKRHQFEQAAQCYSQAIAHQQSALNRAPQTAQFREFLDKHNDNHRRVLRRLRRNSTPSSQAQR